MNTLFRRCALLLVAAATVPAFASDADITVVDPYVRMVPPGTPTTGAFMVVRNAGNTDHKLIKVDSTIARSVELHNHINDNGVMKMRPVKEIEVKAKGEAALKPGSYHVMLIDLKQPLKEGDSVPMTLTFEDGSTKKIDVPVKMPQAMMQVDGDHSKMKH